MVAIPGAVPCCWHLAASPDRGTAGSWSAPRWWLVDKAEIMTSERDSGGTCPRIGPGSKIGIREIRLDASDDDGTASDPSSITAGSFTIFT